MNRRILEFNLLRLLRQRNAMGIFSTVMLMTNFLLCLAVLFKQDKTILLPPELKQSVWFKGSSVSREYLEEMSLFFAHLLLDKNSQNARFHHKTLLKYVHPDSHSKVVNKLLTDEKRYQKEGLSTNFFPSKEEINVVKKTVTLTGELLTRVGNREVAKSKKKFSLRFTNEHSRWYLAEFVVKGDENE
jgi:conjugal transfer pilus assembly protein TraE